MVPASVEQLPRGTARPCKICSFGINLPWGEVQGLRWDCMNPPQAVHKAGELPAAESAGWFTRHWSEEPWGNQPKGHKSRNLKKIGMSSAQS